MEVVLVATAAVTAVLVVTATLVVEAVKKIVLFKTLQSVLFFKLHRSVVP